MDHGSLVREQVTAGLHLARIFQGYWDVRVAFWLKATEVSDPYLHIVSDQIDDLSFDQAYRDLVSSFIELQSDEIDLFRIKIIFENSPLAQAAIRLQRDYPVSRAIRLHSIPFANLWADDLYIYPSPLPSVVATP